MTSKYVADIFYKCGNGLDGKILIDKIRRYVYPRLKDKII
jgi:hypothetical protein